MWTVPKGSSTPIWRRVLTSEFWMSSPAWLVRWTDRADEMANERATRQAGSKLTIHDFYAENEARRGADRRFGEHWTTLSDPRCDYDVFWIPGTEELVAMRAPRVTPGMVTAGNGQTLYPAGLLPRSEFTVEILGNVAEPDLVSLMECWEKDMPRPGSLDTLRARAGALNSP